jgi:hypothetical protein
LLDSLLGAQIRASQFAAAYGLHLSLKASPKLLRHRQSLKTFFHRVASPLLEADSHHGTDDGAADKSGIADSAGEAAGDLGNNLILYLEFLAYCQQNGLRSTITSLHDLCSTILFHDTEPLPRLLPHSPVKVY